MTEDTARKNKKLKFTVGPRASELLADCPVNERAEVLDAALEAALSAKPNPDQPDTPALTDRITSDVLIELSKLRKAIAAISRSHAEMSALFGKQLALLLGELKRTRVLIGSMLVDDDDRFVMMERLNAVTEIQELTAETLLDELGLSMTARRMELEAGPLHLEPVVTDARDPEQDTELKQPSRGGYER